MKKAFSLIEISIVILIIGILIAGTVQANHMATQSRLVAAQVLTQNSVVNHYPGLVAWFETSLESSFLKSEAEDGSRISTWYDNNPQAANRNNATQATSGNQPKFYESIFNGAIPGIRFDGTDDFISFDGTTLANVPYSIFIVEQRRSNKNDNFFLGGTSTDFDSNLMLGFWTNTSILFDHFSYALSFSVSGYSPSTTVIHSFVFDSTNGKRYFLNGGTSPYASDAAQTSALLSYVGAAIGRSVNSYYNGDVAEVIIFKRLLKSEERQAVESYLGKKYKITIS